MRIERTFASVDRYLFDFNVCTSEKGWAQLDTRQDASYYGNWINPTLRQLLSYAEGDIARTYCDTDAEFVAEVKRACEWHAENDDKRPAIDGMCNDAIIARFRELGLEEWLH